MNKGKLHSVKNGNNRQNWQNCICWDLLRFNLSKNTEQKYTRQKSLRTEQCFKQCSLKTSLSYVQFYNFTCVTSQCFLLIIKDQLILSVYVWHPYPLEINIFSCQNVLTLHFGITAFNFHALAYVRTFRTISFSYIFLIEHKSNALLSKGKKNTRNNDRTSGLKFFLKEITSVLCFRYIGSTRSRPTLRKSTSIL